MAQPLHRRTAALPRGTTYLPYEQRVRQGVPAGLPAWAIPSVFTARHALIGARRTVSRENDRASDAAKDAASSSTQIKQPLSPRSLHVNTVATANSKSITTIDLTKDEDDVAVASVITPKPPPSPPPPPPPPSTTISKSMKTKVDKLRLAKSKKPEPATPDTINAALKRRQKGDKVAATKLKNSGHKKHKANLVNYLMPAKASRLTAEGYRLR